MSDNVCSVNELQVATDGETQHGRQGRRRVWTADELRAGRPSCAVCGREIARAVVHHSTRHFFCSREHYYEFRRGGRAYRESRSGQRYARKVVSRYTSIPPGAVVHHIDRNNLNNELSNLMVFRSQSEHLSFHHGNPVVPLWDGRTVRSEERVA